MADVGPNPAIQNMRKRPSSEKSLRDFYYILFRHKRKIVGIFSIVVLTTLVGTLLMPDVYLSSAKLMVRLGRENVTLDPTATTGQVLAIGQERENEINSELEILNSRELAERVVEEIGAHNILSASNEPPGPDDSLLKKLRHSLRTVFGLPMIALSRLGAAPAPPTPDQQIRERDQAVRRLIRDLKVEAMKKSSILSVSYVSENPNIAREVVAKLIHCYQEKHINAHRTSGSYQFFSEQTEQLRAQIAQTEEALKNIKSQTGMASFVEQRRILLDRIGDQQRDYEQTDSAAAASAARISDLERTLASLPPTLQKEETTGFPNSAADELRKRLNELQLREQELLSTFTEKSVPVQEARRQIKEAESLLLKAQQTRQVTKGINSTYQQLQLELMSERAHLSSLRAKAETLAQQLAKAQEELRLVNETEIRMSDLERNLEIQRANYRKYLESLEQTRIDQALEMEKISNISIVQAPYLPVQPIRPNKKLNFLLGLFLGTFGGVGVAIISEFMDHSLKRPEDVEDVLHLPLLAAIPYVNGNAQAARAPMPGLLSDLKDRIATSRKCPAELRQLYEIFMERLIFPGGGNGSSPRVICITSSHPGEGSSTVATHIALTLAYCGEGRVLLIDSNFQNPSVHRIFGVNQSPGLAEILSDNNACATVIRPSPLPNLDLLCSGEAQEGFTWLADARTFAQMLDLWKREYSFIIFDTPAVWLGNHAVSLGSLVDTVILVVESEKARRETVRRAMDRLMDAKAQVAGVVLNKRRFYVPERLYRRL